MKRRVLVLLSGFALACVAGASYAQHHMSGFHSPGAGFHGGRFANGGFHHFHDGRFHARFVVFVGTPFFWGPPLYPYPYRYTYYSDYAAAYGPPQTYYYYCPDQGYYPTIQSCPSGWLRVVPGGPPGP